MTKHSAVDLLSAYISAISTSIVPLTREAVAQGSKVFGAAILKKSDLSLVVASTNTEKNCPLWHGEVHTIKRFYEEFDVEKGERPAAKDCLFLTTHEPCSLCLSAITWAGFDNFTYLFSYEDTRDAFSIPHDLDILHAVFRVPASLQPGSTESREDLQRRPDYNRKNRYFTATSFSDLVDEIDDRVLRQEWEAKIEAVKRRYGELSDSYQATRGSAEIPLA